VSGPVEEQTGAELGIAAIEVREGRQTTIGQLDILRVLPTKNRRTVGPWCFVDLMQAGDVERPPPLEVGPHPHIGLATVTWLFGGTVLHSDSLGTEQLIRPGQLNLMTSGHGIAHAEEGVDTGETLRDTPILGVQMWLAQPGATRQAGSRFQHVEVLPDVEVGSSRGKVFVGRLADAESPADIDHPAIGLDIVLHGPTEIPVDTRFEHALVPVDRPVSVEGAVTEPGSLALVPIGRDGLRLEARSYPARAMLLGGAPLGETVKMWWNFVARSEDEITQAWRDWQEGNDDRFAPVPSRLPRIDAPPPPWLGESG
jgi:quercetin 2,3-dioxygenase